MKKQFLLIGCLLAAHAVLAQHQILLSVVSASGFEGSAGNLRFSSTTGETVIFTATNNVQTLTQGYHQDQSVLISVDALEPAAESGFRVFPNPTAGLVNVASETPFQAGGQVLVFDQSGRLVSQSELVKGQVSQTFDFTLLPEGAYTLYLRAQERQVSFKMIKHNR